uniref:Uncharacterized protein n=1 Tax=Tanacetum cinerariifolium TaxID=118510 RepID=A0A6L2JU34_TANCI|nr:hypothetical protein [Tanacetum cinerariifolium]
MAQQVILVAQLVLKFHTVGRCNNDMMLQSIPCSPECNIIRQIQVDCPLSYALTTTVDSTLRTIEIFMNKVSYQGVVDKVSVFYTNNLAQPWQTMFKVFNCYLTTRTSGYDQTKINILQLFHDMINRTNVDYGALLWDVRVRGMLILDAFLTEEIHATEDFKEQQKVVEGNKDDDDSKDRLEPGSYKDKPEYVDDDDDEGVEKVVEEEGGEMGSLEIRIEKMQTSIPTPYRSPRTILSSDKNITQELTKTIPFPTTTTSNTPHFKR